MSGDPESLQRHSDDLAALRAIVEGTARNTGEEFFGSLVVNLARAINVHYAFVAVFAGSKRARTVAYWSRDHMDKNVEWDLTGTPCEDVVKGKLCHYPTGVAERFPEDRPLIEMGIESYLGVPLIGADGQHLGHLAVFDDRPMPEEPRTLSVFRIFAHRAAAELERLDMERRIRESEQRFRDLYDEAPIAYIYEDTTSRFLHANKAAIKLLGITPADVPGFMGVSLIPDLPEAQRRIKLAIDDLQHGREQRAVELELRRKDDGRPIWVQWWSKPDPDGKHTRTMLVDITDRVLMERANTYLQEELKETHNFEEIVGRSPTLTTVLENVRRVAKTDASVLVTGESGTGKELVARAIHSLSARRDKPLIKVNCAALPTGLVESELFGHERGAFSGAISRRIGRFELANGGTIFLDEVGEIPLDVQVKLLRVLQEREFERVGGNETIRTDVRVIAATNRDLRKAISEGKFREDLFYRLNVFPIQLPPLRERTQDIPLLVNFLLAKFRTRLGKHIESISKETMARLEAYPWPGNVRELENVLERAVILSPDHGLLQVEPELLPAVTQIRASATPRAQAATDIGALKSVEKEHILATLAKTNWVIDGQRGAARLLDMNPNTLRSRMKKLGIERPAHETS